MKKLIVLSMVMALVLAGSMAAAAQTMEFKLDGLYLLGGQDITTELDLTKWELETKDTSFLVNAEVEVYPDVVVEGRYLTGSANEFKVNDASEFSEVEDLSTNQTLMLGGAKYRLLSENGMNVYAGAGYNTYTLGINDERTSPELGELNVSGKGFYGKAGLEFAVNDLITVTGDVAYAPKNKFDVDLGDDAPEASDVEGTLMTARGTASYAINEMLGVQVGVAYSNVSVKGATLEHDTLTDVELGETTATSTLYGAGLVVRF